MNHHRGTLFGPRSESVAESWRRQNWPLRILRAFLGVTFLYAGIQKLSDPNFLHSGTPQFIGTQLRAFATGSPIRGLLLVADKVPDLTGLFIALVEIATGLGTLLGIAAIGFAVVGFLTNVVLLLSATWHVHPYFLGSDSMYAVGWLAYGAGELERRQRAAMATASHGTRRQRAATAVDMGRRQFLRGALLGVGTLVLGVASTALAGPPTVRRTAALKTPRPSSPSATRTKTTTPKVQGTPVAKLADIPVGGAVAFSDPSSQEPSVLVRLGQSDVAAFSRVCTHAGCLVQYDESARLLVCPCHGAEFDPSRQAEPIAGPAPTPLSPVRVVVDRATGEVVAPA